MNDEAMKTRLCTVRMSDEETARAEAVAGHYGINVSSAIRMLLKREARDLGVEPGTSSAKPNAKRAAGTR